MNNKNQNENSGKLRVAILVAHGVGQQMRFDTLSGFAAGLEASLKKLFPSANLDISRELLDHGNVDSMLRLSYGDVELDIVEYYYQPKLQRQVAREDVVDWLVNTAKRVKKIYESDLLKRKPPGDRYLLSRMVWWSRILAFLISISRYLESFNFASPLANFLKRFIFARLDRVLTDFVGDVVAYTAIDPKLRLNEVREDILSGCVNKIKALLEARDGQDSEGNPGPLVYDHIVVAGHSLGSVVGYDAISQINRELQVGRWRIPGGEERLCGLVTFGSPLDKIAMFFWPLPEEEVKSGLPGETMAKGKKQWLENKKALYAGLLTHFHGLRGVGDALMEVGKGKIVQPAHNPLEKMVWLNFYHPEDLIAGHLDAFRKLTNIKTSAEMAEQDAGEDYAGPYTPSFPEAHSYYWYDARMMKIIITTFLNREVVKAMEQSSVGDFLEKHLSQDNP